MRRNGPRVWRGLAIAAVLVGLAVLTAGGVFYTLRSGWIAGTERAEGVVVALLSGARGYTPTVEFRPAGGDRTVRFTVAWSTSPPAYEVGETVPVRYPPADPSDAVIDAHFALWWPGYVLGGIGLLYCALGLAAGVVSWKTARRQIGRTARSNRA